MKILIVTQHFHPENFRFNDLAQEMGKNHQVTVLTGVPNYPEGRFFSGYKPFKPFFDTFNDLRIIRVPIVPRGNKKAQLALNYFSFAFIGALVAFFLSIFRKYDKVLVCQTSPISMAFPAIIYRFLRKTPVILWITDLWPESLIATNSVKNPKVLSAVKKFVIWTYMHVDLILMSCKGFRESIQEKVQARPLEYFPYWAESFYVPAEQDPRIKLPNKFTFMFAGNIGVAQNLNLLVDAVRALALKDLDFQVVIVGEGRYKKELLDYIKKNAVSDYFVFLGSYPAESMAGIYAHADVLYLSLRKDPIFNITVPSKLQSYMACGKPIVASIDGEAGEVIKEANCGLVSEANNLKMLCDNLEKALTWNQADKEKLGSNALIHYRKNFDRELLMNKMQKHLEEVTFSQ